MSTTSERRRGTGKSSSPCSIGRSRRIPPDALHRQLALTQVTKELIINKKKKNKGRAVESAGIRIQKEAFGPGPLESPPLERIGWSLQGTGLLPVLRRARPWF